MAVETKNKENRLPQNPTHGWVDKDLAFVRVSVKTLHSLRQILALRFLKQVNKNGFAVKNEDRTIN